MWLIKYPSEGGSPRRDNWASTSRLALNKTPFHRVTSYEGMSHFLQIEHLVSLDLISPTIGPRD